MRAPFFVFGLPRSRTKWLSTWLALASGMRVAHDLASECDTVDQYFSAMRHDYIGTTETGAVDGWQLIRRAFPAARIVVVYRDMADVKAELASLGLVAPDGQLEERQRQMMLLSEQPDVFSVRFEHLVMPQVCELVHRVALPWVKFDYDLWRRLDSKDITIDLPRRVISLIKRADLIQTLKAEVTRRTAENTPWINVADEPWESCVHECEALGALHHAEASVRAGPDQMDGVYQLDHTRLNALGHRLRAITARVDSRLAGYCTWTHEDNVEAVQTRTMVQGPFFVVPELARLHLGRAMLDVSRKVFAHEGVQFLRLHHTTAGRGARAGVLYQRMGAVETKREYTLAVAA